MPTCPRCALLAVALAFLAFSGCDSSNPGRDLGLIDGRFALESLSFDPVTQGLPTADIGARLDLSGTSLEVFGGDGEAELRFRFVDATGTRRANLSAGASRGRATFSAVDEDDRNDLEALLLPEQFALTFDPDNPRVLTGSFERTGVNLQAFDPSIYQDQVNNRGTLMVTFRRP